MSIPDEYEDLETRLRQSKPQAESLPPALKRQMRQALMERITMNDNRFSFRKLSMALGGLIILIGIPVFFWLAQMSIGSAAVPGAGSDPSQLDPSRPTPTIATGIVGEEVEVPVVELAEDKVWLISADIAQGETVGRYGTINVTVGYELVNVSEAELIVKLVDGPRGVLTVEKMVSGASGTAVIPLQLAALEEVAGESIALELNLILRGPSPGVEKLLYLDFVEGWTIDLTAEPETTAEIIQISKPVSVESEGLPANTTYEIELTTAYTLQGYEEALLVVGYEFTDGNGSAGGYEVNVISAGSGTIPVTMRLDSSFLNARGETIEGVRFFVRINRYDEGSAKWVNLFPGNEPLLDSELSLPYPYQEEAPVVQSTPPWATAVTCRAVVEGTTGAGLTLQETPGGEEITVLPDGTVLILLEAEPVTAENLTWRNVRTVTGEEGWVAEDFLILGKCDIEIRDDQAVIFEGEVAENEIQLLGYEVVTHTTENGVAADITLVVGYNLSSDYPNGSITFSSQYQATATAGGGSGGGGGGSQSEVTSGSGTTQFTFSFETDAWATMQDWLDSMSISLLLFGNTTSGEELLVGEATQIGID
jgi:hypothetical protein